MANFPLIIEISADIRRYQQGMASLVNHAKMVAGHIAQVSTAGFGAMQSAASRVFQSVRSSFNNITGAVSSMIGGMRSGLDAVFRTLTNLKVALAARSSRVHKKDYRFDERDGPNSQHAAGRHREHFGRVA